MKYVFVNGSPRPEGNTGTMLKMLARQAKEKGAEVTYYEILDKNVQDCDGCYTCDTEDRCVKDDDMIEAYRLIQECDVLVIGSPIYMGMETGMDERTMCEFRRLFSIGEVLDQFERIITDGSFTSERLPRAMRERSAPADSLIFCACILRISSRPESVGKSMMIWRSKRPGRSSAGSSTSARLVAAMMITPSEVSNPSISTSSALSVCSRSS